MGVENYDSYNRRDAQAQVKKGVYVTNPHAQAQPMHQQTSTETHYLATWETERESNDGVLLF